MGFRFNPHSTRSVFAFLWTPQMPQIRPPREENQNHPWVPLRPWVPFAGQNSVHHEKRRFMRSVFAVATASRGAGDGFGSWVAPDPLRNTSMMRRFHDDFDDVAPRPTSARSRRLPSFKRPAFRFKSPKVRFRGVLHRSRPRTRRKAGKRKTAPYVSRRPRRQNRHGSLSGSITSLDHGRESDCCFRRDCQTCIEKNCICSSSE